MATPIIQIQPSTRQVGQLCFFGRVVRLFYDACRETNLMRFAPTRRMGG